MSVGVLGVGALFGELESDKADEAGFAAAGAADDANSFSADIKTPPAGNTLRSNCIMKSISRGIYVSQDLRGVIFSRKITKKQLENSTAQMF